MERQRLVWPLQAASAVPIHTLARGYFLHPNPSSHFDQLMCSSLALSWQPLGFQSRDIGVFQDDDGTGYLLTEDVRSHLHLFPLLIPISWSEP